MELKKQTFTIAFLMIAICTVAQKSRLDSNMQAAIVFMDSMKYYKANKQRANLRSAKRAYIDFKKRTRYRYNLRFGIHANYAMQRIGIRKHEALTSSKGLFVNGVRFGFQFRAGKSMTFATGLTFMRNKNKTPTTMDGFVEARAKDSLKIINTKLSSAGRTNLYAPYFQTIYKIPLKKDLTLEPFMRVSYNHLNIKAQKSYFLVSKSSNYNEIITSSGFESVSLAFQPGIGLSVVLDKNIKLVSNFSYSINTLQSSLLNSNPNFLSITPSTGNDPEVQKYEIPKIKNGLDGSIGLRLYFRSNKYAHEKGYNNPAYYDQVFY